MLSKTKISKGYLTVVPKEVRRVSRIQEGDFLEWSFEDDRIVVRPRRPKTLDDIVGLISVGGDAVEAKRRLQRGERALR